MLTKLSVIAVATLAVTVNIAAVVVVVGVEDKRVTGVQISGLDASKRASSCSVRQLVASAHSRTCSSPPLALETTSHSPCVSVSPAVAATATAATTISAHLVDLVPTDWAPGWIFPCVGLCLFACVVSVYVAGFKSIDVRSKQSRRLHDKDNDDLDDRK